jgi:hypothetical protein
VHGTVQRVADVVPLGVWSERNGDGLSEGLPDEYAQAVQIALVEGSACTELRD